MILFMLYVAVVAGVLGLAAARVEAALQGRRIPTRWVWLASIAATVGVAAWALLRPAGSPGPPPTGWTASPMSYLTDLRDAVIPPPSVLERADAMAVALWLGSSLVLALTLLGGLIRLA